MLSHCPHACGQYFALARMNGHGSGSVADHRRLQWTFGLGAGKHRWVQPHWFLVGIRPGRKGDDDNCVEMVRPGVHSDLGGGYAPGFQGRIKARNAALRSLALRIRHKAALEKHVPSERSGVLHRRHPRGEHVRDVRYHDVLGVAPYLGRRVLAGVPEKLAHLEQRRQEPGLERGKELYGAAMIRPLLGVTLAMSSLFSVSCHAGQDQTAASVVGHNHTGRDIVFSVDGSGEIHTRQHAEAGRVCCVAIPAVWRTETSAHVEWQWDGQGERQARDVPLPAYDEPGLLGVHFLRSGEVRAFVTMYALGHPSYPLQGEEATLHPPGSSPAERRERAHSGSIEEQADVQMDALRQAGAGGGLPDAKLNPFVVQQIRLANAYGLTDLEDILQYLILAVYSSGRFVEHPYVKSRLDKTESSHATTFRQWVETIPEGAIENSGPPLWQAESEGRVPAEQDSTESGNE